MWGKMWNFLKNKRGDVVISVILIIIIIIIIIIWAATAGGHKECRSDSDCGEDNYCGSDFKCHQMKIVEKTVNYHYDYNYKAAGWIIGISIIISAIIIKWRFNKKEAKKQEENIQEYPYYGPDYSKKV